MFIGDGIIQAGKALEVEQNFARVKVGVLIAKQTEITPVSLGRHGDFPLRMIVVMNEMIERK